jgi:large subunit ribosomal protein L24
MPDIRKNDTVRVLAGRDKGRQGKVLRVFPEEHRALVEHVMMVKRHTRANPDKQIKGGIAEHESPIHISNLMLVCPECGPTRLTHGVKPEGGRFRSCRKCKRSLD